MNVNRITYIDQLKGIAILLVVLGHVIGRNLGEDNFLWGAIYSFHMPLFMFISGYVAQMTFRTEHFGWSETMSYLIKKLRTLLLPFFVWGIVIPVFFLRSTEGKFVDFLLHFVNIWGGGLWFFATLFLLSIFFYLYCWVIDMIKVKSIFVDFFVLAALFFFVVLLYGVIPKNEVFSEGVRSVFNYFVFYFAGVFVYKQCRLRNLILDNTKVFTLSFTAFCLLIPSFVYDMSSVVNQLMKIALSLCAIPSLFYMVRHVKWNVYVDRMFQFFGRESLAIYVTHNGPFAPVLAINVISISVINDIPSFLFLLLFSFFICFVSIGIKGLVSLSPALAFLLYGKSFEKKK